jgi:hypothetical protein
MTFCGQCGTKSSGGAFCTECGAALGSGNTEKKAKVKKSTPISVRAEILAELWIGYKNNPDYQDFIQYNDLGLPLAYAVAHGIVEMNNQISMFVNETFDVLLSELGVEEDSGFEELGEIFVVSQE